MSNEPFDPHKLTNAVIQRKDEGWSDYTIRTAVDQAITQWHRDKDNPPLTSACTDILEKYPNELCGTCKNCGKLIRTHGGYTWLHFLGGSTFLTGSIWCEPWKHTDPGEAVTPDVSAQPHTQRYPTCKCGNFMCPTSPVTTSPICKVCVQGFHHPTARPCACCPQDEKKTLCNNCHRPRDEHLSLSQGPSPKWWCSSPLDGHYWS